MTLFIYSSIACVAGLLIGCYITTNKWKLAYHSLQIQLAETQQKFEEQKSLTTKYQAQELSLHTQLATVKAMHDNLLAQLEKEKAAVVQMEEKLTMQFKHLANDILEEKSKKFTAQNQQNLEAILKPLGERIQTFEKQVEQTNKEGLERAVELRTEIQRLYTVNIQITKEADNLARAIKGDTKMQGNWGEFILENILDKSGLLKDREYQTQASFISEDGKRYQPDVIINLPAQRHVIIDAKVSLVNYEQFFNIEKEEEKGLQLKKHLLSVRKHINLLSEKNYQTEYNLQGLDFVLMFIPIEPAFNLIMQYDSAMLSEAYEKNIILVSPTTLIATLRTITSIWRQEYQNRNALEIAQQGGALYDKFIGLIEDLKQVGKRLDATKESYEASMNKLCDGKGSLISRVEKIKLLGARTTKTMDQRLLDKTVSNNELLL